MVSGACRSVGVHRSTASTLGSAMRSSAVRYFAADEKSACCPPVPRLPALELRSPASFFSSLDATAAITALGTWE